MRRGGRNHLSWLVEERQEEKEKVYDINHTLFSLDNNAKASL